MSLAYKISAFNRGRKYRLFLKLLAPREEETILDVGFNDIEYSAGDNYLEKNYPRPEKITALGLKTDDNSGRQFSKRYPKVKTLVYEGRQFPFKDQEFAIVWSNAVLEHVGAWEKQLEFLKEIKRVGGRAFITTPNKNFPVEIHTRTLLLHFLPEKIFQAYLRLIGKSWANGDYMHLLSERKLKELLAAASIDNYQIIKNRLAGFTLDFVIIF